MRCLHCGEKIDENTPQEAEIRWHTRCIKNFFGTPSLPELKLDAKKLERMVLLNVSEGLTIPGVQKKLSLHLQRDTVSRLTLVDYPTGYIMKPQAKEYKNLPEFEWTAMRIAKVLGIKVVPFALYHTDEGLVYLTKRIDRQFDRFDDNKVLRYAMEDFCQLTERLAEDKYKGSYEACAKVIKKYSSNPGLDISELFLRVVVSYVMGNSDLHLKNFSLIEDNPGMRNFSLSQAYDILPVNVVEPRDPDEMALSLNGKKRDIKLEDMMEFAKYCDIDKPVATKIIVKIRDSKELIIKTINESFLNKGQKTAFCELVENRCKNIGEQH